MGGFRRFDLFAIDLEHDSVEVIGIVKCWSISLNLVDVETGIVYKSGTVKRMRRKLHFWKIRPAWGLSIGVNGV